MSDNTILSSAIGTGDTVRDVDKSGIKTPVSLIDVGGSGAEVLVSSSNPLPASLRAEQVDDAAFTPATSRVLMVGAEFDDAAPDSVDEGDGGAVRMSANRVLYVTLRDAAGNERGLNIDSSGNVTVNVTGTVTVGSHAVTNAGTFAVQAAQSGTWNITNISGTISLPTGAATAAKQPALGTAGSASSDVITIQGIASGTVVPVSDGGGSLTVDGSVSVSGLVPGTSATSLGKAEDAVAADGDTGVMALAVRKDTAATTTGADGDYHPLEVDGSGRLWVNGSGVTQPVSGTVTATVAASAARGEYSVDSSGPFNGTVLVSGYDGSNARAISTTSGGVVNVAVNGTTTVALTTGAGTIVRAEDDASANADAGVPMLAVRKGTPANTSGTDGDYEFLQVSAGRLWVDASGVTLTVASHAVTNAGTFATQSACAGDVAHDGVDSGNPVKVGGQARTTNPTAVADADRSNFITDKLGKQVVVGSIRDLKTATQTKITSSTAETTILAAVASTFLDLYGLLITNTSASACKVTIKDSTAGTTRFVFEVPATDSRGFMLPESAAHVQATVNNNWTATCGTSVDSIEISAMAVKNT